MADAKSEFTERQMPTALAAGGQCLTGYELESLGSVKDFSARSVPQPDEPAGEQNNKQRWAFWV